MKVKDLMTRDIKTCYTTDAVAEAARLMWDHDCGAIPVLDEQGALAGMITDRDIAMAAFHQGRALHEIFVGTVMSRNIWSCKAEGLLAEAERLMRTHQVRRLPVVDADNHVVGLLSLNDLARAGAPERGKVPLDEVGATLASICAPHLPATRRVKPTLLLGDAGASARARKPASKPRTGKR